MGGDSYPMISVEEALKKVLDQVKPMKPESLTNTRHLHHRIVAEDVVVAAPGYPPYRASIMDGYAVACKDGLAPRTIVDRILAGDTAPRTQVTAGAAYYVTTGAAVPEGCDCVVPVEECTVEGGTTLTIVQEPQPNAWIRPVGCDLPAGSVVLPKGHVLDAVALGLWRQSGQAAIQVLPRPTVGVLSTGNELSDSLSDRGLIPDVNRPVLLSLLDEWKLCATHDLGVFRDDEEEMLAGQLLHAECQIVITTGSVSMGESDILERVLVQRLGGTIHFGRLNMKPGKPTTLATLPNGTLVVALPGNPVSAYVCAHLLVRPALEDMVHGHERAAQLGRNRQSMAPLAQDVTLDHKRPEYHRVFLKDGVAVSTGVQRSSRLVSLRDAEALMLLPAATNDKKVAQQGEVYPLLYLRDVPRRDLSQPVAPKRSTLQVAVYATVDIPDGSVRIEKALSGSKSGSVRVTSVTRMESIEAIDPPGADLVVVVGSRTPYALHLEQARSIRSQLTKVADALALQARQGAAQQDPTAALFEVVVGYRDKAVWIYLPDRGLDGGLSHVRGLLKHALELARGTRQSEDRRE